MCCNLECLVAKKRKKENILIVCNIHNKLVFAIYFANLIFLSKDEHHYNFFNEIFTLIMVDNKFVHVSPLCTNPFYLVKQFTTQ